MFAFQFNYAHVIHNLGRIIVGYANSVVVGSNYYDPNVIVCDWNLRYVEGILCVCMIVCIKYSRSCISFMILLFVRSRLHVHSFVEYRIDKCKILFLSRIVSLQGVVLFEDQRRSRKRSKIDVTTRPNCDG